MQKPHWNRVEVDERLLHGVEPGVREPLDRHHLRAGDGDRQQEAAQHPVTVHEDRAGAALAVIAATLRAGQTELLAECLEQRAPRVHRQFDPLAVHDQLQLVAHSLAVTRVARAENGSQEHRFGYTGLMQPQRLDHLAFWVADSAHSAGRGSALAQRLMLGLAAAESVVAAGGTREP